MNKKPEETNDIVAEHYKEEAEHWGKSSSSTMDDEVIREKETGLIMGLFDVLKGHHQCLKVADIGCGNGYTLGQLIKQHPENDYWGVDSSLELLKVAQDRHLASCRFTHGDVGSLQLPNGLFDVVYTQRCLINVLSWPGQAKALTEIYRILKPDGLYLMIECFTDGLMQNNRARRECGLPELKQAAFNEYLDEDDLQSIGIKQYFDILSPDEIDSTLPSSNFLSSHYFIARVLHALVTKGEQIKNTQFVKFFSCLPPVGDYSPLQAYVLRKKGNSRPWSVGLLKIT